MRCRVGFTVSQTIGHNILAYAVRTKLLLRRIELCAHNSYLVRETLPQLNVKHPGQASDSLKYKVLKANVIKNSFRLKNNYLTIDKGTKDGVKQDMGVLSPQGVVGIIENTSERFATVQSVLNTRSALNAMVKRTQHFGSLRWDTREVNKST